MKSNNRARAPRPGSGRATMPPPAPRALVLNASFNHDGPASRWRRRAGSRSSASTRASWRTRTRSARCASRDAVEHEPGRGRRRRGRPARALPAHPPRPEHERRGPPPDRGPLLPRRRPRRAPEPRATGRRHRAPRDRPRRSDPRVPPRRGNRPEPARRRRARRDERVSLLALPSPAAPGVVLLIDALNLTVAGEVERTTPPSPRSRSPRTPPTSPPPASREPSYASTESPRPPARNA